MFSLLSLLTLCSRAEHAPGQFQFNNPPIDKLNSRLYDLGGSVADMLDANVVVFNNAYSNSVNADDALKLFNSTENFAIKRDGRLLVVEGRQAILEFDTVYFEIWNLQLKQYTFDFDTRFANANGLVATLMDKHLGISRQLKINDTTRINFTCDANAGSRARDRFKVVFRKPLNSLPVNFLSVYADRRGGKALVGWSVDGERGVSHYDVERSFDGRDFHVAGSVRAQEGPANAIRRYNWEHIDAEEALIYYRVKNVDLSGSFSYSAVVKLEGRKNGKFATVYPNPVAGKNLNLLLRNHDKGSYAVELISSQGALLHRSIINHFGGSSGHSIQLPQQIPVGTHFLRIRKGGEKTIIPGIQILH